jgi:hypothetical protein
VWKPRQRGHIRGKIGERRASARSYIAATRSRRSKSALSRTRGRRIAFGVYRDWEPWIRTNLDPRYSADFIALDHADLEAFDAVARLQIEHYNALARRPDLFGREGGGPERSEREGEGLRRGRLT